MTVVHLFGHFLSLFFFTLFLVRSHIFYLKIYVYTSKIPNKVFTFHLQFVSIQAACEHQILASLSSSSCLEVYYVTSALGLVYLASAALTVAVWRFTDIALTPQFLQLSFHGKGLCNCMVT